MLAKEQTPTNFALDDSIASPPPGNSSQSDTKKHVEFSETVTSKEVEDDPWWNNGTNGHEIDKRDEDQEEPEEAVQAEEKEEWEEEEEDEEEGAGKRANIKGSSHLFDGPAI